MQWVADHLGPDVPLHVTAFHPAYHLLEHDPTPPASLSGARAIARQAGLHSVYTGNVRDPAGSSTECTHCAQRLIGRDGYRLTHWSLSAEGCCTRCATPCPSLFEATPGDWGSRRMPVRLADELIERAGPSKDAESSVLRESVPDFTRMHWAQPIRFCFCSRARYCLTICDIAECLPECL